MTASGMVPPVTRTAGRSAAILARPAQSERKLEPAGRRGGAERSRSRDETRMGEAVRREAPPDRRTWPTSCRPEDMAIRTCSMFSVIRFDLRAPGLDPPEAQRLYAAALEMSRVGRPARASTCSCCPSTTPSADGYLPSPLVMGGAVAARTERIPIWVSALLVPLHDPVRLAEDIAVLDLISNGRIAIVTGLGYRPVEYALFDREWKTPGQAARRVPRDHGQGVDGRAVRARRRDGPGDTPTGAAAPPDGHGRRLGSGGGQAGGPLRVRLLPADRRRGAGPALPRRVRAPRQGAGLGRPAEGTGHAVRGRRSRAALGPHRLAPAARRDDLQLVADRPTSAPT